MKGEKKMAIRFSEILRVNAAAEYIDIQSPATVTEFAKFDLREIFDFVDRNEKIILSLIEDLANNENVGPRQENLVLAFFSGFDEIMSANDESNRCWQELREQILRELPRLQESGYHTLDTVMSLIIIYLSRKIQSISLC